VNLLTLYGQIAVSLALGAGLSFLPIPRRRLVGMIAAALTMFTVAPALYALLGPLSFTLAQIALLRLSGLDVGVAKGKSVVAVFVVLAVLFYVLALGAGPYDPFGLGYGPFLLLALIIPLGLLLAWQGEHVLLAIAGLNLLAYGLGLFANLWSALFDPLVVVVAALRLFQANGEGDFRTASLR
jgi:hypothetical protein